MTTKPYYVYYIRFQWHGRVETPAAIGAKFLNTLDALSSDRSHFQQLVGRRIPKREFRRCRN